jgi:hypothetical protein
MAVLRFVLANELMAADLWSQMARNSGLADAFKNIEHSAAANPDGHRSQ